MKGDDSHVSLSNYEALVTNNIFKGHIQCWKLKFDSTRH